MEQVVHEICLLGHGLLLLHAVAVELLFGSGAWVIDKRFCGGIVYSRDWTVALLYLEGHLRGSESWHERIRSNHGLSLEVGLLGEAKMLLLLAYGFFKFLLDFDRFLV